MFLFNLFIYFTGILRPAHWLIAIVVLEMAVSSRHNDYPFNI